MNLKTILILAAGYSLGSIGLFNLTQLLSFEANQAADQKTLKTGDLKPMLENMGYEPKTLSEDSYEVKMATEKLTVYLAVSLSKSEKKVWLVSSLREFDTADKSDANKFIELLRMNAEIQPAHFYMLKDKVLVGMPLDNRGVTPIILRQDMEKLVKNVGDTQHLWDKKR